MIQEIKKLKRDKKAYIKDVPEAAHRDNTSVDSIKSVIKISECCRPQSNVATRSKSRKGLRSTMLTS